MKLTFQSLRANPGETHDVLPETEHVMPDQPPTAMVRMKRYAVRLRHDFGIIRIITTAPDHKVAISNVLAAADAPRKAVISIKKLK